VDDRVDERADRGEGDEAAEDDDGPFTAAGLLLVHLVAAHVAGVDLVAVVEAFVEASVCELLRGDDRPVELVLALLDPFDAVQEGVLFGHSMMVQKGARVDSLGRLSAVSRGRSMTITP